VDPRLIAGLIPEPLGQMSAEDRKSIDERAELIEERALARATAAVETGAGWTGLVGAGRGRLPPVCAPFPGSGGGPEFESRASYGYGVYYSQWV